MFVSEVEPSPAHSTLALVDEKPEEEDPWDLPELKDTGIPWSGENTMLFYIEVTTFFKKKKRLNLSTHLKYATEKSGSVGTIMDRQNGVGSAK